LKTIFLLYSKIIKTTVKKLSDFFHLLSERAKSQALASLAAGVIFLFFTALPQAAVLGGGTVTE